MGTLRTLARRLRGWGEFVRIQRPVTRILGPQYRRSRKRIEIDITWLCNLSCPHCNRSCPQAPTTDHLSLQEIEGFLEASKIQNRRWEQIRILGGEPTLHPEFPAVIDLLHSYWAWSGETVIELATNGTGARVKRTLASLPDWIQVDNTDKEHGIDHFVPFNRAPMDRVAYALTDKHNACWVAENCGMGFGPGGYYPCGPAAGIDRIFGFGAGRPQLPDDADDMEDLLELFCSRCGGFQREVGRPVSDTEMSDTWVRAYARHRNRP
jgi:hypothetical protein